MPHDIFTGKECKVTFDANTNVNWLSWRVEINKEIAGTKPANSDVMRRVRKHMDAKITLKGLDSEKTGAFTFKDVAALCMNHAAPSAMTFTDDAGTPVSKLPSNFFTKFPLAGWRLESVSGEWSDDPADWEVTLLPNFDD